MIYQCIKKKKKNPDINGLWVFKRAFYGVCGWGQWSLNTILFLK
jgi:hypothetical protein